AGLISHRSVPSSAFSELTEKAGTTGYPPTESAGPEPGRDASSLRYQPRDASASQPKTLKNSGFRPGLNPSASLAAAFIFFQTPGNRTRRAGACSPAVRRAESHALTVSTKAASGAGSTP